MPISVLADEHLIPLILERVDAALDLISLHDPRRFRRLTSDLRSILIVGDEDTRSASFVSSLRWCVITTHYAAAEDTTPEDMASTLVHEATHARLATLHIVYDEPLRRRIEIACGKQQLAFARRLPGSRPIVGQLEARVSEWRASKDADWSDATFREDAARRLRDNAIPGWLVRSLSRLRGFGRPNQRMKLPERRPFERPTIEE